MVRTGELKFLNITCGLDRLLNFIGDFFFKDAVCVHFYFVTSHRMSGSYFLQCPDKTHIVSS